MNYKYFTAQSTFRPSPGQIGFVWVETTLTRLQELDDFDENHIVFREIDDGTIHLYYEPTGAMCGVNV